ncbi:LysR family transcriptional regulator [Bradyrhizobium sp. ORS 111]|uniref:LysR family transcriptional regulator n=1 Tax=Bradyrhizobium sp. ORS 111 TaxID=1685958 RepID=UPI00388F7134
MQIHQLRYLIAIAEAGSFSAAARRAFVTQPTLSAAIDSLEIELGRKLFERQARGVVPTAECARILEHARSVLREIENIKSLQSLTATRRPIRIGVLVSIPAALLSELLAPLKQMLADRPSRIEIAPLAKLRERLGTGRYDAIITNLRERTDRSYRQLEFTRDRQVLAFPKSTVAPVRPTPKILQLRPIIVRTHCEFLQRASRILDEWHVRPIVVTKTDSDSLALAMVAAGFGACLVPDSMRDSRVDFIKIDGVELERRIGIEWIKGAAGGLFDVLSKIR